LRCIDALGFVDDAGGKDMEYAKEDQKLMIHRLYILFQHIHHALDAE
jgi:hypothetical protein